MGEPGERPTLTDGDAWIALALCDGFGKKWKPLRDLVASADYWNHAILTFDEVSYGLPRLAAAGLVELRDSSEGPLACATPECRRLRATVKCRTLGGTINGMAVAVGAVPWPGTAREDRSLGRLPGLGEALFDSEVSAYQSDMLGELGGLASAAAKAAAGVVAAASSVVRRGRRR